MTDNGKIAGWLGYQWIAPKGYVDGWWRAKDGSTVFSVAFDKEIALWHGEKGLLAEIEKRELRQKMALMFVDVLRFSPLPDNKVSYALSGYWDGMNATPAQLATALVKMIEEGK